MSESAIEWCDRTHNNVVTGCSPASPGCDNCWAARTSGTRQKHLPALIGQDEGPPVKGCRSDLVVIGTRPGGGVRPVYNGSVALDVWRLALALKIPRNGGRIGNRIFWNSTSDTFHERLSFEEIEAQFAVMATRTDLQFLVLTKRPERARQFFDRSESRLDSDGQLSSWNPQGMALHTVALGAPIDEHLRQAIVSHPARGRSCLPLTNVAIGVSAEDQKRWDERVPILCEMKRRGAIATAFVSAEPMIGPIVARAAQLADIGQVIIGAESGPGARPMPLAWAQDLGRQVLDAQQPCDCLLMVGGGEPARLSCTACQARGFYGPSLFLKQAAVCEECHGRAGVYEDAGTVTWCPACNPDRIGEHAGQSKKVRKHCPEFWIPGHGARSWAQSPPGWGP